MGTSDDAAARIERRFRFERRRIRAAWNRLWPEGHAHRRLRFRYERGSVAEWPSPWESQNCVCGSFSVTVDVLALRDEDYMAMVNWGNAIGFPPWAPAWYSEYNYLMFDSIWAPHDESAARRDYLWQHRRADPNMAPVITQVLRGKEAEAAIGAAFAQTRAMAASVGVPVDEIERAAKGR